MKNKLNSLELLQKNSKVPQRQKREMIYESVGANAESDFHIE